jgi:PAP2 superfamily
MWNRIVMAFITIIQPTFSDLTVKGTKRLLISDRMDTKTRHHREKKLQKNRGKKRAKVHDVEDTFDLGIRFNKVGGNVSHLTIQDYPIDDEATLHWLRTKTLAVSVIHPKDCYECSWEEPNLFPNLVMYLGGPPSHPSQDPNDLFWNEFREIMTIQILRRRSNNNVINNSHHHDINARAIMPLPNMWKNFTLQQIADAVHDPFLGLHHIELMRYLLADGATVNRDMVPSPSHIDFVRGIVMLCELNTYAIRTVAPFSFGIKWWIGRARPEEVAWLIANGTLGSNMGVPRDIVQSIHSMRLDSPTSFTAFPEGSPCHPSWPAMHSAASSASLWLAVVLNLNEAQYCEVKKVDYAIAYARTVAGVHYPSDNLAGLELGQEIMARYLPKYLSETYGSDEKNVQDLVNERRFKWKDFLSSECLSGEWTQRKFSQ